MARRYQVRLYNAIFKTLLETVPDSAIWSMRFKEEINGEYSLTFTMDRNDSTFAAFGRFKTVQLRQMNIATGVATGVNRHYRIDRISDIRNQKGEYGVEIFCEGLHYDLAWKRYFSSGEFIEQTPTTIMTAILAGTGWSVGTVTPTATIDNLKHDYSTVMELLQELSAKTGYELDYTTNPGALPTRQVHLKIVGNQSSTSSITLSKNLLQLKRDATAVRGNLVYGIGGGGNKSRVMTIANATHRITAINGSVLTLDSTRIIGEVSGFASGFSIKKPNGTTTAITSAEKSTFDKITVSSVSGLSVGDKIRFVHTSSGAPLEYVHDYDSILAGTTREVIFRDENLNDVENLIGPASSSAFNGPYSSGLCTGWLKNGVCTTTENSDTQYIVHGSRSQKVVVGSYTDTPTVSASALTAYVCDLTGASITYKAALLGPDGEGVLSSASSGVAANGHALVVTVNPGIVSGHIIGVRVYRSINGGAYVHVRDIIGGSYTFADALSTSHSSYNPPADTTKVSGGIGIYRSFTATVGKEYSGWVKLFVTSGKVRVELFAGDKVPPDNLQQNLKATDIITTAPWTLIIDGVIATQTAAEIRILSHDGPATFYVDSGITSESPYAPDENNFVGDNSATTLWYAAYDELVRLRNEANLKQYGASFLDLYENGVGTDEINIGDLITLTDTGIGVNEQVRVISKEPDGLQPWNVGSLELSSRYQRSTDDHRERKRREQKISASLQRQMTRMRGTIDAIRGANRNGILTIKRIDVTASDSGQTIT